MTSSIRGRRYLSPGSRQPLKLGLRFSAKAARDSIRSPLSPCSCSLAANALWAPDGSGFFYFVAKDDKSHVFSRTVEEHERNVDKYMK